MLDTPELVLASTSPYRKALLQRLGLPFECANPEVDETAAPGETSESTALRLAEAKARAVAPRFPGARIIGADQVATCGDLRLGKPGAHDKAVAQLLAASGAIVRFDTAVALFDARTGVLHLRLVPTQVHFRHLARAQIEAYLRLEQPYDCAGSAKAEGLGIALIERIESSDPTALIGLPLIALTELLASSGLPVLRA